MNIVLSIINFATCFILIGLAIYGFNRFNIPAVRAFTALVIAMAIHAGAYGFELLATDIDTILIWIRVEYIGSSFYSFLVLFFTREYIGDKKVANKIALAVLGILNLITLIIVNTNNLHHLYYKSMEITNNNGLMLFNATHGIWYIVNNVLVYFVFLYSLFILGFRIKNSRGINKKKISLVFTAYLIPLFATIFYQINLKNSKIDILPMSFVFMAILIFIGFYKYRVTFLTDITYDMIFNHIEEGIVTIDSEGYLINKNDAAATYFPQLLSIRTGDNLLEDDIFSKIVIGPVENNVESAGHHYKVNIIPLIDFKGKLLVFSDITESVLINRKLEKRSITDELTGLYNRRYAIKYFDNLKEPGFLFLLDIDDFKEINDTLGHVEGDYVLKELGKFLKEYFPDGLACKYGGDEFLLIQHCKDFDAFLKQVYSFNTYYALNRISAPCTFSIGLSSYILGDFISSVADADKLMYEAKDLGKNKIVTFDGRVIKLSEAFH